MELYNIQDYQLPSPFLLALVKRGSLDLISDDTTQPMVRLHAIKNRRDVYELIRDRVETLRFEKKGYFAH